jgi:hypothetical protein
MGTKQNAPLLSLFSTPGLRHRILRERGGASKSREGEKQARREQSIAS